MQQLIQKLPVLIEFFFNGSFIALYSLKRFNKIPNSWDTQTINQLLEIGSYAVPVVLFMVVLANYLSCENFEEYLRKYVFSILVFIPLLLTWGDLEFCYWLSSAHLLSSILAQYDTGKEEPREKKQTSKNVLQALGFSPAQWVLISFSGMILLGTFLLMLPVSSSLGKPMAFIDAIFMATSATCVTGLSTISLANDFSTFGQVVILILIQIGGLGIMTLYFSMAILLGQSLGMKDRVLMQDLLDVSSLEDLFLVIVDIIKYAFFIELWGGIVLTIGFSFEGFEFGKAIYYGFFHSISAFCNAGFSLFNTSLESYGTSPLIHGTVAILITLGGLGFIVLKEMKEVIIQRRSWVRITLHTKVVLITSFVLTTASALFIFFGEFLGALDGYSLWEKMQIAIFQSVTLRTAGFNTIPLNNLSTYTIYAMSLFMFIGASPGSTGGGIKTSTLAILVQSIVSTLRGRKKVFILDRVISSPMVVSATAITFISILITSFFILLLMRLEPDQSFLTIFFETISASGTVGLSLGITPFLSGAGKLAISALMLIGRIGPLTLMLAIGERRESLGKFDYPDGRIMIG